MYTNTALSSPSPIPVNPKADANTLKLKEYLVSIYGSRTLSGQQCDGLNSTEIKVIERETGRRPAVCGFDFIDYSISRVERGAWGHSVEDAIAWHKAGGITTFCWHWNAPKDLPDAEPDRRWYSGFYTKATNFDISATMDGRDEEGYRLLLRDIDLVAVLLKRLEASQIPIIFRPLHEASGGWFWWGAKGPAPCIDLYRLLYDRLTNLHNINNLLWAWNGQDPNWYPGDDVVDLIGEDLYPQNREHSSQKARFKQANGSSSSPKLIALTENGALPDIDRMYDEGAPWLYFCTWCGDFVFERGTDTYSEYANELDVLKRVYNHPNVINLGDLPDLFSVKDYERKQ